MPPAFQNRIVVAALCRRECSPSRRLDLGTAYGAGTMKKPGKMKKTLAMMTMRSGEAVQAAGTYELLSHADGAPPCAAVEGDIAQAAVPFTLPTCGVCGKPVLFAVAEA